MLYNACNKFLLLFPHSRVINTKSYKFTLSQYEKQEPACFKKII